MAEHQDTSGHVPVLEAVQPPNYRTSIPERLVAQLIVIAVVSIIVLCFLVWGEMPPIALGFSFAIIAIVVGLAIYNAKIMRVTSGTDTHHVVEVRNAEMEAQTAQAMYAMSQTNNLGTELVKQMIAQTSQSQQGMMPPPLPGQFTRAAPLRKPTSPARMTQDKPNLLEYQNDDH